MLADVIAMVADVAFVKCAGKSFLYLVKGVVLTSALGSTLTGSDLLPCFITI